MSAADAAGRAEPDGTGGGDAQQANSIEPTQLAVALDLRNWRSRLPLLGAANTAAQGCRSWLPLLTTALSTEHRVRIANLTG